MTTSNVTVCTDEFLLGGEGSFLGFHYGFPPPGIITPQREDVSFVEGLNIFIRLNKDLHPIGRPLTLVFLKKPIKQT